MMFPRALTALARSCRGASGRALRGGSTIEDDEDEEGASVNATSEEVDEAGGEVELSGQIVSQPPS